LWHIYYVFIIELNFNRRKLIEVLIGMCRLVGFLLNDREAFNMVFKAFIEASRHNFIAEKTLEFRSHDDGWGVSMVLVNENISILNYKTRKPVWKDMYGKNFLKKINASKILVGIIHSRKASKDMPINGFSSHPYTILLNDGSLLYLVQNGGINREKGYKLLNEKYSFNINNVTDTFIYMLLLKQIYDNIDGKDKLIDSVTELHKLLLNKNIGGKCINTMILQITPLNEIYLIVVRAIYKDSLKRYCELYVDRSKHIFCSSTIAEKLDNFTEMGENKIFQLKVGKNISVKEISLD